MIQRLVPADATEVCVAFGGDHREGQPADLLQLHRVPALQLGYGVVLEEALRDRRLAVFTNKPLAMARTILDGLDIAPFFAEVLGGDSVARKKPDPIGLLDLIEREGVAPERTLMICDSANDVRTARAACASYVPNVPVDPESLMYAALGLILAVLLYQCLKVTSRLGVRAAKKGLNRRAQVRAYGSPD